MTESHTAKPSSKYKAFMFDGIVTLYIGPEGKKMEIHKKLLASISPELDKHVNNNMKEGIEGVIHLPDEEEETLALFSEWAYTGSYAIVNDTPALELLDSVEQPQAPGQTGMFGGAGFGQTGVFGGTGGPGQTGMSGQGDIRIPAIADPWPSLRMHLQLYVLADKFNIPTLKLLAKSNFSREINAVELTRGADAAGLSSVIDYAYDNLPDSDPVPKFLARYASWRLGSLRGRDEFTQLASTRPEFVKELLVNLTGPSAKPTLSC